MIPFNKPSLVGKELNYIADAFQRGKVSGDGFYTEQCRRILEMETGCSRALLTTSCTHALEMAALLLNLGPGDEVIFPTFTFVSTPNAFLLRGIIPVFVDSRPDTLNINEDLIEAAISSRTKAIVVVHYGGVGCEMDRIMEIAARHNLPIIEDNAHGLFAHYRNRPLGSFGTMATQSFHETKNFSCGEGGALLLNDPAMIERAEIIREKGTNRSMFFRGEVAKYTWVDIGSSYLPSDILAAVLLAQLEHRQKIQTHRKDLWDRYHQALAAWSHANGIGRPTIPSHCQQAYHLYYFMFPSLKTRTAFISYMKENGVLCVFHYLPLHLSEVGRRYHGQEGQCPVAEAAGDRLVRLPMYYSLTEDDQRVIIEKILSFRM